mgnify:CR=1 FL=1
MAKKHTKNDEEEEWVYDPVKEIVGNKAAEKVIWSTKSLELAVAGIKKGMPLKANPFCGKNTKLLKPNLVYKRTKEEIDDYIKCMQDPIYFASLCYLMTPKGLKPCVLRDYQVEYLKHLKEHRFSTFLSCRQSGKSFLSIDKITILIPFNIYELYKKVNYNNEKQTVRFYKKLINMIEKYEYNIYENSIIITIPAYELFNCFNNSIIWKIRYMIYNAIVKIESNEKGK